MRIVLDTNILVAAIRSRRGASAELLKRALNGDLEVAVTTALSLEYEAVATRPVHLKAAGLPESDVVAVIDSLIAVARRVPIRWKFRPQTPDPNDELVLDAAFNGHADALVTLNSRHLASACRTLGIRAVAPDVLLRELRSKE